MVLRFRRMGLLYLSAVCSALCALTFAFTPSSSIFLRRSIHSSRRFCIDTEFRKLEPVSHNHDDIWRTKPSTVISIEKQPFIKRPELLTFNAVNTLIRPSQSIGRWLREALNTISEMRLRLPRPALFTGAFNKAYEDMCKSHPCFGVNEGMSSREWWFEVVRRTYHSTPNMAHYTSEEIDGALPEVFNLLYDDIFGTKEGWMIKENVEYVLPKLQAWRDQGAGPKLGVISNFDDRLPNVLKDLGILSYFDFIMTSREAKSEKPSRGIFDAALAKAGCSDPGAAYHVGDSLEQDVTGAVAAGWAPMRFREWFDEDFPDWTNINTVETAAEGAKKAASFMTWGRRDTATGIEWVDLWSLDDVLSAFGFPEDPDKPIPTTYIRGVLDD